MLEVNPVNLVQAGGVTLQLFGLYLLKDHDHYRIVKALLLFSLASTVTNFSEEVLGSRDWYLVSPIYLMGIGPMFYLCAVALTENKHQAKYFLHLLPMLLALPFTHYPQWVIAAGSLWFFVYGVLTFKTIAEFEQRIVAENSNTEELSLRWLMKLVGSVAVIYALDFLRLNLQPHIDHVWNLTGQLAANIAIFMTLAWLIKKLLQYNNDIALLHEELFGHKRSDNVIRNASVATEEASEHAVSNAESTESPEQYLAIFQHLENQILDGQLFRLPRLSLTQLAAKTELQTRDISRAINLCAKLNFNDYINQHRVNAIKAQLERDPGASLLQVGLDNGFNSKTSFNNVFKRLSGMTPGQFKTLSAKSGF